MSIGGTEPNVHEERKKRSTSPLPSLAPERYNQYSPEFDSDHTLVHFNDGQSHSPNRRPGNRGGASSPWARTSFKIGKSRPSKVRHLSREELWGIGLALLLSFLFTSSLVVFFVYGTPLVINKFQDWSGQVQDAFAELSETNDTDAHTIAPAHTITTTQTLPPSARQPINYAKDLRKQLKVIEDMSEESFKAKFVSQRTPALFTFPVCSDNQDILTPFLNQVENASLVVHPLDSLFLSGKDLQDVPSVNTSWRDLLSFQFSLPSHSSQRHYYACDDQLYANLQPTVQHSLADLLFLSLPGLKESYFPAVKQICVGHAHAQLSGTSFLLKKERIHYLTQGEKHWVLFPASAEEMPGSGFNPLRNLQSWIDRLPQPTASATALNHPALTHVIQRPGQFLYIPEGWYHASQTISSDASISFTFERESTSSHLFYHYLEEGNHRMLQHQDYKGALRMYKMGLGMQRNVVLLERLADVNVQLQNYLAAEELYREVMDLNPANPIPYGKLIELLINYANKDISDSIASLLKQAEENGIKEEVLQIASQHL